MKFMKLGSKLDTFYTAEEVRSVSSEVSRDIVVQVKGCKYLLHKFPLLSKSAYLQRLCSEIPECAPQPHLVQLPEFPGGPEAFELCAKFCYGITITLSASNIVAARCAAEFLQMTEEVETGNMIQKLDVFFNSCVLNRWRDTIVALRSTLKISTWSEEFGITKKCVEAISAKILANPLKAKLPCSGPRKGRSDGSNIGNKTGGSAYKVTENKAWWFEDLSDLCMDLYWRVTISIKSSEKIPPTLIGDALKVYASKWLPSISNRGADKNINLSQLKNSKQILIFYSIISLLPTERSSASCKFLCKLLKAANLLNASSSSKMELTRRIAAQLEEANVSDLLIPNPPNDSNMLIYNVDIVMTILEIFLLQGQSPQRVAERRRSKSTDNINFEVQGSRRRSSSASHSSKLKVAKLVDGYLQEIAKDANLPLSKFVAVAESVPVFARLDHDALYKAIDTYLEAHPDLGKNERKRICRVLDCGKLSMEASAHAAHNEKLPLRVVVQLLFLEHSKIVMSKSHPADEQKTVLANSNGPSTPPCHGKQDQWNTTTGVKSPKPVHPSLREEMDEEEDETAADGIKNSCMLKNLCGIPARPKKMLSKLWPKNWPASLSLSPYHRPKSALRFCGFKFGAAT